jgi:hypothetical protein
MTFLVEIPDAEVLPSTERAVKRRRIEAATSAVETENKSQLATATWSSGVPFYPPSEKYWRIGGKWYDFSSFLQKHPGGGNSLLLCRDRFEDCTFVFESHHHNYKRARAIIKKYEVSEDVVHSDGLKLRPKRHMQVAAHHDSALDASKIPEKLLPDDSFYSVIRVRVTEYLRSVGRLDGSPTTGCIILFWATFASWISSWFSIWYTGSFMVVPFLAFSSAVLGAFGHNWVHQPKYKFWAYLSLDTIGFSSDGWFREHNLQHHMYTNTPWDNHFKGTDPFLVTDPTVARHWLQVYITPYLNPIVLCFGVWGNWIFHFTEVLQGHEVIRPSKFILPLQVVVMVSTWSWLRGIGLVFSAYSLMSVWYFTMALMNHNAELAHACQ